MKKVSKAHIYFLIILMLQLFLPVNLVFKAFNVKDIKLMLFINHIIIFILPAIIYIIMTRQSFKSVLKLNKLYFKDALWIILLAFVCQPIMAFFSVISQFIFENEIGNFMTEIVNSPYIILLLLVAVLPAISEEITIRGIVLSGYEYKNTYLACAMTGLLFGIMHLDPQQFLYATVLGFILALVVRVTNSIFASALIHFIINGTSITLQKIMSLINQNNVVVEEAADISIRSMPLATKLSLASVYGVLAVVFSIFAYFIIRKIAKLNIRRGIISESNIDIKENKSKENVFNIPFIMIIILYILIMIKIILV